MFDYICPFSATLSKDEFACENAQKVIRRGGEEFICQNPDMHSSCNDVYVMVRKNALSEMELEDDLTSLPHSALVKIQFGCLLGLLRSKGNSENIIDNISTLIASSLGTTAALSELPLDEIYLEIAKYRSPKRRRKK